MIIQCNSCQKSFNVPDNAITEKGRLVQCSACGNKWTQYLKISNKKEEKISAKKILLKNQLFQKNLKKSKSQKKKMLTHIQLNIYKKNMA